MEIAERRLTEKLFLVMKQLDPFYPTDPMVEIYWAPQAVFISIFFTKKDHFEAKDDADFDYVKKIRIRN